jgi:uncharacterized lipoprotein YmbA
MRLQRRRLLQLSPLALIIPAGCSSGPPAQYFRLVTIPGRALRSASSSIQVRNVSIPQYLDRTQIIEPSDAYQVAMADNELWASPLGLMLQTVLVQDLAQRLPDMSVTPSSGMIGTPPDLLVEINVLRFDPDQSGRVELNAQLALKAAKQDRFLNVTTLRLDAMPSGPGVENEVAAMSGLWAGLADALARQIAIIDLDGAPPG